MLSYLPTRQTPARRFLGSLRFPAVAALGLLLSAAPFASAQISLGTAVDLALSSNPRVLGAKSDVDRAIAQRSQAHDAYIPSITAGAGIGQSYGYSPQPPTLFTVTAGSLVYSSAQFAYLRSANAGIVAARLSLEDTREAVAEDTSIAFITLDHDQQREQVVRQQAEFANALVSIVQKRLDAGQDNQIELTQAKLTAAQMRLAVLHAGDDAAVDREHLAHLIGLPPTALSTDSIFPSSPMPFDAPADTTVHGYANAAVASAFSSAEARRQQAAGDATFRFRPQLNLVAQYNRYATFTDSFSALQKLNGTIKADEGVFGIQIVIPVMDRTRVAKARETAAEAARSLHDAQNAQIEALDGQARLRHSLAELQAQTEVATLQQQLAQEQLDIVKTQLQNGTGNPESQPMTPKDEQKARISERDKYLGVVDATFQLRQAEIHLLRQTGQLETWLKSGLSPQPPTAPTPQP
ncbi:MAG TPA: TolC family protein [Acidobacteriaceae bacterium]|jgi:outer membrane protein TolC